MGATIDLPLQFISAFLGDKDILQLASISLVIRRSLSSLTSDATPVSLSLEGIGVSGLWHHFELWEVSIMVPQLSDVEVLSKLLLPDARAVRTFIAALHRARKPPVYNMMPGGWELQHLSAVEFTFPETNLAACPAAEKHDQMFAVESSKVVVPMLNADIWLILTQELCSDNTYGWSMLMCCDEHEFSMEPNLHGLIVSATSAWYGFRCATDFIQEGGEGTCVAHEWLNGTAPGHQTKVKDALEHGQSLPFVLAVWMPYNETVNGRAIMGQ